MMSINFIRDLDDLDQLSAYVNNNKPWLGPVAFDLETNSVEETQALVWGIGLAFDDQDAFYIPIRDKEKNLLWQAESLELIADTVTNYIIEFSTIGHNIIYDTLVWENNFGKDITRHIKADTILMKHCLDEEPPFGLKEIAVKELGPWADKAQQAMLDNIKANGGSTTKTNLEMWKCDTDILGEYCCWDVLLTYKLFNKFSKQLEKENLTKLFYLDEVMPLYKEVTIPMKRKGLPIDLAYFSQLKSEIELDIKKLEIRILEELDELIAPFCLQLLADKCPVKKTGSFPRFLAEELKETLPDSLAKKQLQAHPDLKTVGWMLFDIPVAEDTLREAQLRMWFSKYPDSNHVFNLRSRDHLKNLFFDTLGLEPLSKTETGLPQVDDTFLDSIKLDYVWVPMLRDLNKLEKIKGTYIEGILDRQHGGIIYASMLQFGTTSGRYASRNPNLQNLPRPKEEDSNLSETVLKYTNAIRAGFIAPTGYKFVDADYSALEPRCFAHMSNDKNLQMIFHSGEDMYSAIAKRVFNLTDVGTYKKDANFLGKLYPEKRQIIKALALAVTYGAEAFRIADLLGVEREEAQKLIDDYLTAYPGLKDYIKTCHDEANNKGSVSTIFGRIRHLKDAKDIYDSYGDEILNSRWAKARHLGDERRLYKNKLNNSTNFKIQGLAAHIVNRAMIKIMRRFKDAHIDGWVTLQVHDQIVATAKIGQEEAAKKIIQECMESVVTLSVPLVAEPKIATNLKDSH